ncbi:hypothetical protein NL676_038325 [Syzygium grande]|nr:hypothetical protein NL676_038325 [Syzygium grande]
MEAAAVDSLGSSPAIPLDYGCSPSSSSLMTPPLLPNARSSRTSIRDLNEAGDGNRQETPSISEVCVCEDSGTERQHLKWWQRHQWF